MSRLRPRQAPRPLWPTRTTGVSPIPYLPYLSYKVKMIPPSIMPTTGKKNNISKCQSTTPTTPIAAAATPDTPAQARHRSQPNAISTTPATQTEDRCHQVPRLPRKKQGWCLKMPRLPRQQTRQPLRPKRATGTSPMPYVPRLSHKVKIDMWGCCCVWANSVIVVYEQVVWWQVDKVWE